MAIFIDAHVHIYPEFDMEQFFSAAFHNFIRASRKEDMFDGATFVLALAEGRDYDVFAALRESAEPFDDKPENSPDPGSVRFYKTAEPDSLLVCKGEHTLLLIAGRQHVSKENIEVLSLFCADRLEDKSLSLPDLAHCIADSGGIVVLPWGVGKWFGARGERVKTFLESVREYSLFLGDNGNRPSFWPTPSLFGLARKTSVPLLSGSDPLPLRSHCDQVATSGTLLVGGTLSLNHPAESLRQQLKQTRNLREFGKRLGSLRFLSDQIHINLLNRFV